MLLTDLEAPLAVMRAGVDEEQMVNLVRSIKENGLINPIVVRKKGDKYELIAGYRRVLAHEKLGIDKIMARVVRADDLKAERMKIDENREREDVNALDEGVFFRQMMQNYGWNQKELAQACRYSEAYVSQRVSSIKWPEILRDAIIDGKINFSVARELAGVNDPGELDALVLMAVKSGVTPGVAAQWRHEANRKVATDDGQEWQKRVPINEGDASGSGVICATCGHETEVNQLAHMMVCPKCMGEIAEATRSGVFVKKEGE